MRKTRKLMALMLSVTMLATCGFNVAIGADEPGATIYVSALNGNDSNAGTVDAPLKTIDAARLMAREISGAVTVEIMAGEYRVSSSINFDDNDSNVTYKAYGEDTPVIKGSIEIPVSAAGKISVEDTLFAKMTEEAQKYAYVIDLSAQGITKDMIVDGAAANGQYALVHHTDMNGFYVDENALNVAQWPNNNDYAEHSGKGATINSIIYKEDKCDDWADSAGWWVGIWMPHDYSYFRFGGVSTDADTNTLTYIENPASSYKEGQEYYSTRWKAFNLIEEMDVPGEYFIDRENLKLYFYPTSSISDKTLEFEVSMPKLFNVSGAENITFDGLLVSQVNGCPFYIEDVENVDIKNSIITDIGGRAIYYNGTAYAETGRYYTDSEGNQAEFWQVQKKDGSYDCDIENNIISNIGGPAITMAGAGDIDNLTPSNNTISNNIISNVSTKQVNRAVNLGGCGVTFKNNNVSSARQGALVLYGNDHLVSYNEIYNVLTESSDGGIIYQGQSDVFRGTKVEYNYIHDALLDDNKTYTGLKDWQCGIYWDDRQTGMEATHNIIKNVRTAFNSNQAGDFVHSFNTVVDSYSAWSLIESYYGEEDPRTTQASKLTLAQLAELIYDKTLYYSAYDNLEAIVGGKNPITLSVLEGNLNVNSGMNIDEYYADNATFINNQNVGTYEDRVDLTDIFVDPDGQDYRVKADSDYAVLGVLNEDFNINLIGIQNEFELTEETASFEKLYPAQNENLEYQDEYNFTWSPALGANNYKVTVATDEEFKNVEFEKETIQTGVTVTGLDDETTYYWKVEAENISRELASTWTTVDGVTSFGINVSQYEDTAVEMPENQISNYNITTGNLHGGWSEQALSGYEGTTVKVTRTSDLEKESTWQLSPFYLTVKAESQEAMNAYWLQNQNYVMSVNVKDDSAEGLDPAKFNMYYGNYHTRNYTDMYPNANSSMQLTKDWQKFAGSFTIPVHERTEKAIAFVAGIPTNSVIPNGQSIIASNFYLAKEVAYDIEFSGRKILGKNAPTELEANVLNQVGTNYSKATGEFTWAVTDSDRNAVDGFSVTPSADSSKVTVSVSDWVSEGKYVIVAESDGIKKGFEIEVINNFEDTPAVEKPANIQGNFHLDGGNSNIGGFTRTDNVEGYTDNNARQWVASQDIAKGDNWQFGPVYGSPKDGVTFGGVEGDNYVVSVMVKDASEEGVAAPEFGSIYGTYAKPAYLDNYPSGTRMKLTDEWQEYAGTYTLNDAAPRFVFGLYLRQAISKGQGFVIDDMYIAEEVAYDIKVEGETTITLTDPATFSAEVINQIGKKGNISQEIDWIVLDKERNAAVDGILVEDNNGSVTVSVDNTVSNGNYVLVAISNGIVKGTEITVISDFSDTPAVEKPANIQGNFHLDGGNSNIGGFTRTDNVEGYTDNNARQWVASQDIAKGDNWQFGPVYGSPKDGVTFGGVEGDNYVVSVMVKDASEEGVAAPEFGSIYGTYAKPAYLDNYPSGTRMKLTDEWQEYAGTYTLNDAAPRFVFGLYLRQAISKGQGFVIDDMYIAEEVAYELKITGKNSVAPSETVTLTAEVLNQIGRKGKLNQEIEWVALNADRTAYAEGIELKENADGTVTVTGVSEGEYTVVAMAKDSGIIKGYTVTVSDEVEALEKISSAVFEKNGTTVNFKATVENTDAEKVLFVIAEFNGKTLVQTVKSDIKSADDTDCDLTLENVTTGNTVRAFIWDEGTLFPIDNPDNLELEYIITA